VSTEGSGLDPVTDVDSVWFKRIGPYLRLLISSLFFRLTAYREVALTKAERHKVVSVFRVLMTELDRHQFEKVIASCSTVAIDTQIQYGACNTATHL
jgi:hypothetical protein